MNWTTIERIVANLQDLEFRGRISWFWINEPLRDSRILDIVAYTRRACPHAFLSLVTNGDLLNDDLYRDLRRSGLDALGISIYDTRAAQHAMSLQRDERMVLMDMCRPRPPTLENRGGNIKRYGRLFDVAREQFSHMSCDRPSNMMTVNTKGQVVLCCSDLYSDVVMGDVATERLEQIWTNQSFAHYRTHLSQSGRQGLPLCGSCSYSGGPHTVYYPLPATPKPSGAPIRFE